MNLLISRLRLFVLSSCCTICVSACRPSAISPPAPIDTEVSNRLYRVWISLHDQFLESDRFPLSLSGLKATKIDPAWLVCPGTGSTPGSLTNVESWTDFVYVGGGWDGVPFSAVLISPPENHRGNYGYAIFMCGVVRRFSSAEIAALVKRPWLMASNSDATSIEYLAEGLSVRVPVRYRAKYGTGYQTAR